MKNLRWLYALIPFGGVCFLAVVAAYWLNIPGPISKNPEHWGQFGDYVGGLLNPIFGLLTLVVVILAFFLQSKEFGNSVRELRNSTKAMVDQGTVLKKQTFENTLFQMLHLHNTIINSLEHRRNHNGTVIIAKGRDAIQQLADELTGELKSAGPRLDLHKLEIKYEVFYQKYQRSIGHYFRLLYNIFKFVDESDILEKRFYSNLVRAQLSSQELVLLFYNCLTKHGREKFKPLIERYSLLKTLPDKKFYGNTLESSYNHTAYGRQL